ncbi:MSMEG_6728 family protein [Nocardiopsis algeriensis]|uniref:Uncharacterized protein n=1 Tax=Nocardiopsis algeriensis TaxID=1478215 RepID=A0A841IV32_9ACTN|nr:MSMEG_6728 family protein [Nocardiopsis algeriensis]MBB6121116.1 hypothetical protein [Nocardiopsis algeriensis]
MQTFLPHASFAECARVLEDRRLGKQRVETLQILRALVWPRYGWKRHPAVAMWRGFVPALVCYGAAVCREWRERGRADAVLPSLTAFTAGTPPDEAELWDRDMLPPWLGAEDLHRSHRSNLVAKDEEHYRPLFPETPRGLPYVWPRPAFPYWPLRRGGPGPMEIGAAERLLGTAGGAHTAVIEQLVSGRSVRLHLPEPGDVSPGLLAGLCTPGETLWLVPGQPPPRPAPRSGPALSGIAGRPSPSVARPPGPEDEEAMRAEADEPEFRFRRVDPDSSAEVRIPPGTGLVVVEGPDLPEPATGLPVLRLLPPRGTGS